MSSPAELVTLRKNARRTALSRKEKPTTVHLLAALCAQAGPARELLAQRRLDETSLLKAARAFDEELDDALSCALAAARDVAHRSSVPARTVGPTVRRSGIRPAPPPTASGIHVLVVLLSNRRYAAYRALQGCGVDVSRLRTASMQIVLGVVMPPRASNAAARSTEKRRSLQRPRLESSPPPSRRPRGPAARRGRAVEVPLMPPLRKPAPSLPAEPAAGDQQVASEDNKPASVPPKSPKSESSSPAKRLLRPRDRARLKKGRAAQQSGLEIDEELCPTLAQIGRNLSSASAAGQLDAVIGREAEIERSLEVLAKRHANSALLLGPAGVGKTSVARGIAAQLAAESREDAPQLMVELALGELLAGTSARGSLAERLGALRGELRRMQGRVVLLVDEIHELLAGGADELISELKAGMACGELTLVGTTTPSEYRRYIENDPVLARRFTVVEVNEPSEADAFLVLRAVCEQLGRHHDVAYSDEAVAVSVSWSIRYLPGRALPDKAVALLDLAGARVRRRAGASGKAKRPAVMPAHIAEVVSELAEVPIDRLMQTDHERMVALDGLLAERVVGHSEACSRIAAVLRRNAAGLRGRRPVGTFLLLGPTGVGKTETAKAVAELLFHSADAMTRLDMSEYAEAHAVAKLIGAPPGYVGHEAGGLLTEAVQKRPYQVILLDEIEKAHTDVLESFLQVFDEGRLTDGRGRTASFDNTVLVLTSNLGAEEMRRASKRRRVGFGNLDQSVDDAELSSVALDAARAALPPELYNRIDEVIFFAPLARVDVAAIARRLLAELAGSLAARQIVLDVDESVIEVLMDQGGYDPELGARPMRRTIVRLIEAPLADMLLRDELQEGSVVLVSLDRQGEIVLDAVDAAESRVG